MSMEIGTPLTYYPQGLTDLTDRRSATICDKDGSGAGTIDIKNLDGTVGTPVTGVNLVPKGHSLPASGPFALSLI